MTKQRPLTQSDCPVLSHRSIILQAMRVHRAPRPRWPRGVETVKQTFLAVLSLLLCANATAKDKKDQTIPPNACLAVYPGGNACVGNWGIHAGRETPNCFSYLESANFPMKEIKTYYLKKDLEKLEGRGVKVVVTNDTAQVRASACPAPEK
jgi:hypothetical protein